MMMVVMVLAAGTMDVGVSGHLFQFNRLGPLVFFRHKLLTPIDLTSIKN
jgi:hypothetical protein